MPNQSQSMMPAPIADSLLVSTATIEEAVVTLLVAVSSQAREAAMNWLQAQSAGAAPETTEVLTVERTALLLDVSQQTVHDWRKRGILPAYKLGNRVYFKHGEVLAALQAQSTPDGKRKYARRQYKQKAR